MPEEQATPLEFYARRKEEMQRGVECINRRRQWWQALSLIFVVVVCAALYEALTHKMFSPWSAILPAAVVAFSMKKAGEERDRQLKLFSLGEYYDKGIARLQHKWDLLDEGKHFLDPEHIYATDLDLFGRGSVFQLLCSARTHIGRATLAAWMKNLASRKEVLARREAVCELHQRRDLLERVASAGTSAFSNCRPGTFQDWVAEMSSQPQFPSWARILPIVLAAILITLPCLYWTGVLALQNLWLYGAIMLALEGIFAGAFASRVRFIIQSAQVPSVELPIIRELLGVLESERFVSAKMISLSNRLKEDKLKASAQIRRLERFAKLLAERDSPWFTVPSWLLLWGSQFSMAIARWHQRHGSDLLKYIDVLGEFEALVSLATYSAEHPHDIFAEIVEEGPLFEAEQLGHPLLNEETCVRNDVRLGPDARFLIISGSNMSGKSTFLRAVGVNAVLSWMGAPARCAKLRLSKFEIAAAIRVQDSLVDGRSHFFAEMQRMRRIIDIAGEISSLFLIDEIMSGTNSHDRRIAAEWVVRALMRRNAIGLITTHDLALTQIAANGLPGRNFYFEDSGEGGNLNFDYKLRAGLLTHSNALNIVNMLGIGAET